MPSANLNAKHSLFGDQCSVLSLREVTVWVKYPIRIQHLNHKKKNEKKKKKMKMKERKKKTKKKMQKKRRK